MKVYKTTKGYFYKEYKNGKKVRISKENYLKLKKQKGGETNEEIEKQLKKLIYEGIYGIGDKELLSDRKQVSQDTISSSLEKLKDYYKTKHSLFNKNVNSHKKGFLSNEPQFFGKRTSDPRFVDKKYIDAIRSASNDTFLNDLIQTETISEGDREQIKNRAKEFITPFNNAASEIQGALKRKRNRNAATKIQTAIRVKRNKKTEFNR